MPRPEQGWRALGTPPWVAPNHEDEALTLMSEKDRVETSEARVRRAGRGTVGIGGSRLRGPGTSGPWEWIVARRLGLVAPRWQDDEKQCHRRSTVIRESA
jgi:hypothetical protein